MQVTTAQLLPQVTSAAQTKAAPPDQSAKISHAASDFEALLIQQMMKSARESADSDSDDDTGAGDNSSLMELGEQQFARTLASSGGLGIAKMVVAGLSKHANR